MKEKLLFDPGTRWRYSNSNYYLLGVIIEKVAGTDYYDYLQKNITGPLGLHSISSGNDRELVKHRAHGYRHADGHYTNAPPWYYLIPFSAGSLLSNAGDLVKYRRAIFHSPYISQRLRDLVTTTTTFPDGTLNRYTLGGLISSRFQGHRKLSHSGGIYGFSSNHSYYPDNDLTIVILTNNQETSPSPVWMEHKIARVVLGLPQPKAAPQSMAPGILQRYAGNYHLGHVIFGAETYGFVAKDGKLSFRFGGVDSKAPLMPLVAVGDGAFVMADNDEWRFQFDQAAPHAKGFKMEVRDAVVSGSYK
jgi:CubicO group peptidase (beta-lactamase class C family)